MPYCVSVYMSKCFSTHCLYKKHDICHVQLMLKFNQCLQHFIGRQEVLGHASNVQNSSWFIKKAEQDSPTNKVHPKEV